MKYGNSHQLSLYFHVPFCKRKCLYCDFSSEDWGLDRIDTYVESLISEIYLRASFLKKYPEILSVYIGGGSPNLLNGTHLYHIVEAVKKHTLLDSLKEFTIEVNPGGVDFQLLIDYREIGINRISLGCQSFADEELRTLGRIHTVLDIEKALGYINGLDYRQRNLDFIYGIPGQTLLSWENTLRKAISTNVEHLSLYNLIYERGTRLYDMRQRGQIIPVDEELEWQMYDLAHQMLDVAGYEHYEISNWAKPNSKAIHNMVYWNGGHYLGFGPAAHSFDGTKRWWNYSKVSDYTRAVAKGKLPVEQSEALTDGNEMTEFILLRLRTSDGIDVGKFDQKTGISFTDVYKQLRFYFVQKDVEKFGRFKDGHFVLNHNGWFICDSIIERLITIIDDMKI